MLIESFSNYWNDFLYNNDPTERPEILKKRIGIFQCVKIATIVLVCTLKELARYLIARGKSRCDARVAVNSFSFERARYVVSPIRAYYSFEFNQKEIKQNIILCNLTLKCQIVTLFRNFL